MSFAWEQSFLSLQTVCLQSFFAILCNLMNLMNLRASTPVSNHVHTYSKHFRSYATSCIEAHHTDFIRLWSLDPVITDPDNIAECFSDCIACYLVFPPFHFHVRKAGQRNQCSNYLTITIRVAQLYSLMKVDVERIMSRQVIIPSYVGKK